MARIFKGLSFMFLALTGEYVLAIHSIPIISGPMGCLALFVVGFALFILGIVEVFSAKKTTAFVCQLCNAELSISSKDLGKTLKCPSCRKIIHEKQKDEKTYEKKESFYCPRCGKKKKYKKSAKLLGKEVSCKECKKKFDLIEKNMIKMPLLKQDVLQKPIEKVETSKENNAQLDIILTEMHQKKQREAELFRNVFVAAMVLATIFITWEILSMKPKQLQKIWKVFSADPKKLMTKARNPNTSKEELLKLAKNEHWRVRDYVAVNPATPLEALQILAKDTDNRVKGALLHRQQLPNSILVILSKDQDRTIKSRASRTLKIKQQKAKQILQRKQQRAKVKIAGNPNTSKEVLIKLAKDNDKEIRAKIIKNPNTPIATLEQLAKGDLSLGEQRAFAGNSKTPSHLLTRLEKVKDLQTLRLIASHPNTAKKILKKLAYKKRASFFAVALAKNPKTPVPVLEELYKRYAFRIKVSLAQNPNTPLKILLDLARSSSSNLNKALEIRISKKINPKFNEIVSVLKKDIKTKLNIARHSTSYEILKLLYFRGDRNIKEALAKNPHLPMDIMERLLRAHLKVKEILLQHPNFPPKYYLRLLKYSRGSKIEKAILKKENVPMELLVFLVNTRGGGIKGQATKIIQKKGGVSLIVSRLQNPDKKIRANAALALSRIGGNLNSILSTLTLALKDSDWQVRYNAIKTVDRIRKIEGDIHSLLSILSFALNDSNSDVRYAVVRVLGRLGKKTTTHLLIKAIADPNRLVAGLAKRLLGKKTSTISILTSFLQYSDPQIQYNAIEALGKMGKIENMGTLGKKAIPILTAIAIDDGNSNISLLAKKVLKKLIGGNSDSLISILTFALKNPDWLVRYHTVKALSKMGKNATSALNMATKDRNSNVSSLAKSVLSKLKTFKK